MAVIPTFAEYRDTFGLPDAPDLAEDDRITVLWLQYDQMVWERVNEMKADPDAGGNLRGLFDVLSEEIIDSHLGTGWFEAHVDASSTSNQTRTYLHFQGAQP
jgi:hypothetical protein